LGSVFSQSFKQMLHKKITAVLLHFGGLILANDLWRRVRPISGATQKTSTRVAEKVDLAPLRTLTLFVDLDPLLSKNGQAFFAFSVILHSGNGGAGVVVPTLEDPVVFRCPAGVMQASCQRITRG
jgi:hypothetical protein